jgi:hypothetical protein
VPEPQPNLKTMKCNVGVNALSVILAATLFAGTTGCSKTEKTTTESTAEHVVSNIPDEGEVAYSNFRTFMEEAEADSMMPFDARRDWNKEIADREAAYNERVSAVDQYSSGYDEERKAEIQQMKTQYDSSWTHMKSTYASYGKARTMRPELLSIGETATDLSSINPTNIRTTYENFIKQVETNKASYTNDDWKVVGMAWNELDNRKNEIQSQLSAKDKYEIGKAKTKYMSMKSASKTGNTAEKAGSEVKDATKTGAEKTGNAVKKGGQKVESGAKKAGSETKDLYKKAEDKVDGTKDKK